MCRNNESYTTVVTFASKLRRASFILPLAIVAACTPKPKYSDTAQFDGIGPDFDTVAIDVFVSDPPKPGSKTALDLSPEGQAAFVEAFASDPDKITSALANPIRRASAQPKTDSSRLDQQRRLTFTVVTTRMLPADRIVEAHVTADAPEGWRFVGWSGFSVIESDVKAATIVDTANARLKATADLDLAEQIRELIGLNVEGELSRGRTLTRGINFNVVEFLPRLTENTAELVLNAPFPNVNLAGSYTVDVSMRYDGEQGWVKTTDVSVGRDDTVEIRRGRTVFPAKAEERMLKVSMPYVVRRVAIDEGALTLEEDDDAATYQYVGGGAVAVAPAVDTTAKVGSEVPSAVQSLGFKEATRARVSALFLDDKPLKLFVPGSDQNIGAAACIISGDSAMLGRFALWVTEDPDDRIAVGSGGDTVYVLVSNNDDGEVELVDPSLIRADNGGSTIEVRRFELNFGPEATRPDALIHEDCELDVWKPYQTNKTDLAGDSP